MSATVSSGKANAAFAQMQSNMNKYARANDRRMVFRSLKEVKHLMDIPLEPIELREGPVTDTEEEISMENVTMNGLPFKAVNSTSELEGDKLSEFLVVLRELCRKLCQMEDVMVDAVDLYESLLQRMSRTNSSNDSYFRLNSLMGSPDLLVMPTAAKSKLPISVNLYVSKGVVHATISSSNTYGIFRKADVKPSDLATGNMKGRPWIDFLSYVDERVNFANGASVRTLRVKIPDAYY